MRYIVVNLTSQVVFHAASGLYLVVDTLDETSTQVIAYCEVRAKAQAIANALNGTP